VALAVAIGAVVAMSSVPSNTRAADASYALGLGGLTSDYGWDIAVDAGGNSYVIGTFTGTADFDPGPLTQNIAAQGAYDDFVARYSPAGKLVWAFGIGGTGQDNAVDVAVKGAYVYVVGDFAGTVDFDPGPGLRRKSSKGSLDGFILKLNRSNGSLAWVGTIGGPGEDVLQAVAVDDSGQVVIAGHFSQTADLDPSAGVSSRTSAGLSDVFIAKLRSDGTLTWARRVGGSGIDDAIGVDLDGSGNIFAAGFFSNTVDFDPGTGVHARTSNGSFDDFILKLTPGGAYVRAASVGGTLTDYAQAFGVTSAGAAYLAGIYQGTADFDPGPGTRNRTSNGGYDMYVVKLNADGTFAWVDVAGSGGYDSADGLRVGTDGRIHVAGRFSGATDFDPGAATFTLTPVGGTNSDVLVWTLSASGGFVDAWQMGGTGDDVGTGIDVLGSSVYTTGAFEGSGDFDPGVGTKTLMSHGDFDAFVSRVTD
jgi:hypothetical protein